MIPDAPIFLIGYRGTGKSTVARVLAARLGWTWLDADAVLEARTGRTIKEVFADVGEPGFRDREAELLAELSECQRCVIATGGGVVLRHGNRKRLKSAGAVVWLTADPDTLWQRIHDDQATAERRPTLTVGGIEEVRQLLAVREPLYRECASFEVSTSERSPDEIAKVIMSLLQSDQTGGA